MLVSRRSLLAIGGASLLTRPALAQQAGMTAVTAYRFSFDALDGGQIKLSDFAQRPILVVNTASFCGFANQFEGLEKLWATLGPRGLAVIGVPSNDFGGQEPGAASETREVAAQHGVTFPLAAKTVVAGPNAHPFYRWAASLRPRETPRWNFHKYLVGADGHLAGAFATEVEPEAPPLVLAIQKELAARS